MRSSRAVILSIIMALILPFLSCKDETKHDEGAASPPTSGPASDSVYARLLLTHVREHYDDLHDVAMRYHHEDHTLGGRIETELTWEDQILKSADVLSNETGSEELAQALIDRIAEWKIEGLAGPYKVLLPIKVRLAGIDDPDFLNRAILSGKITDSGGNPIDGAVISFKPQQEDQGAVPDAVTNREGIFIRTLIPPGRWTLECSHDDYNTAVAEQMSLTAGGHTRQDIVLTKR